MRWRKHISDALSVRSNAFAELINLFFRSALNKRGRGFDIRLSAGYMPENPGENDPKQFGAGDRFRVSATPNDIVSLFAVILGIWAPVTYGSLVFTGGFGNPLATFSYKSGGRPQSSRRRVCTSVNGDNMACVCPLTSTTLTLSDFITPSSNSALGRVVWRPG